MSSLVVHCFKQCVIKITFSLSLTWPLQQIDRHNSCSCGLVWLQYIQAVYVSVKPEKGKPRVLGHLGSVVTCLSSNHCRSSLEESQSSHDNSSWACCDPPQPKSQLSVILSSSSKLQMKRPGLVVLSWLFFKTLLRRIWTRSGGTGPFWCWKWKWAFWGSYTYIHTYVLYNLYIHSTHTHMTCPHRIANIWASYRPEVDSRQVLSHLIRVIPHISDASQSQLAYRGGTKAFDTLVV
jgi:hypothetical protein